MKRHELAGKCIVAQQGIDLAVVGSTDDEAKIASIRGGMSLRISMRRFLLVLVVAWAGASVFSCSKDRSTTPTTAKSRVYVTVENNPPPPTLLIFDAETDSLVDSLKPPIDGFTTKVTCDPSAPRFIVSRNSTIWAYAGGGASFLGQFDARAGYFAYYTKAGELVGSTGSSMGVVRPHLQVLDAQSLAAKYEDTIGLATQVEIDNSRGLFYGISYQGDSSGEPASRSVLCAYDLVHREFHDCWEIRDSSSDEEYYLIRFAISPDGGIAYLVAFLSNTVRFVGLDLDSKSIFFDRPVYPTGGVPEVTPDGRHVWLPIGADGPDSEVDRIHVFNATTGQLESTIDLRPYRYLPYVAIKPGHIRFTPDGTKAYVMCVRFGAPMLVIDTDTYAVRKTWYADSEAPRTHRFQSIDIGPAP